MKTKTRSNFCPVADCVRGRERPSEFCHEHAEILRTSPAWREVRGYFFDDWRPAFCAAPLEEPPAAMLEEAKAQHERIRTAFQALAAEVRRRA